MALGCQARVLLSLLASAAKYRIHCLPLCAHVDLTVCCLVSLLSSQLSQKS